MATSTDPGPRTQKATGQPGMQETATRMVDTVSEAAADAGEAITRMADTTTGVLRDAERSLRSGPDVTLAVVGSFSVGAALGLLAANANRLLVFAALIPAFLVASAMSQRGRAWSRGDRAG